MPTLTLGVRHGATLNLSPLLIAFRDEAERIGVSFPALLTTDLARYRALAESAVPALTEWEWGRGV